MKDFNFVFGVIAFLFWLVVVGLTQALKGTEVALLVAFAGLGFFIGWILRSILGD